MLELMQRSFSRKIELRALPAKSDQCSCPGCDRTKCGTDNCDCVGCGETETRALPEITGYAAVFNQPSELLYGSWYEIIDPHYFDAALKDTALDLRFFSQHNKEKPVARLCPAKNISSLSVSVDTHGLKYSFCPTDTSYGRDMVEEIRSMVLDACSIGHFVAEDDWTGLYNGMPLRRLMSCQKIEDMSLVTYPAWPTTEAALRGLPGVMSLEDAKALVKAKLSAPGMVPLSIREKEIRLKRLDG